MFISSEKKLLFLHNPKTAGTSITNALNKNCNDGSFFKHLLYEKYAKSSFYIKHNQYINTDPIDDIYFKHLTTKKISILFKELNFDFKNFVEIVVVRNPIDRLLSYYNFVMHKTYKSIEIFLDHVENKNVDPLLCYNSQLDYVINPVLNKQIIFKYEELNSLNNFLNSYLGIDFVFPKINVTEKKYVDRLDDTLRDRCYHILKEEYKLLGYN